MVARFANCACDRDDAGTIAVRIVFAKIVRDLAVLFIRSRGLAYGGANRAPKTQSA